MSRRFRIPATRALATFATVLCVTLVLVDGAAARDAKDGRGEVRVGGSCGAGATSKLKLKSRDGGIELEFDVDHNRAGTQWRVAIVHERRVAWRGTVRTSGSSGSLSVERRLPDLLGSDTVTARAWGPAGVTCRATATLPVA
jgi:hypothetical protein